MKTNTFRTAMMCATVLLSSSSCSSLDAPQPTNRNNSTDYPLVAEIVSHDSMKVAIRYTLTNATGADRIVFDIGGPLRTRVVDGELRLFKGQYDPGVASVVPLLISGQVLAAGESITETAERPLPITNDFRGDDEYPLDTFEFCIGHSDPADQTMSDDPIMNYYLMGQTDLSRNECVMLSL